jgi:hypothetical protein
MIGPADSLPGDIQGAAEAVDGGVGGDVRPQILHQLFAMQTMLRRKGQQLDQILGLAEGPIGFLDLASAKADLE